MIDPRNVSACLITKDPCYPKEILNWLAGVPFGEILILTHCDSPHRKHELFAKAKHDYLYYNDDDCLPPAAEVLAAAEPDVITCAMKPAHIRAYSRSRIALIGWGSVFPKRFTEVLGFYRARYGMDLVYKRETERIMTYFNYPQRRLELPIVDLPSAMAPDRLSMQPGHYDFIPIVEERCAAILRDAPVLVTGHQPVF